MPGSVQHGHEVSDETLPGVAEATAGLRAESWTEKRWKRRHDHALHLRRQLRLIARTRQDLLNMIGDVMVAVVENGLEWRSEEVQCACW